MRVRTYQISDTQAIMQLFYDTVHQVNCRDYTQEQVEAWAPANMDIDVWMQRLSNRFTYVAEDGNQIIGFGELESTGHIDCFYCHKDFQRQGVSKQLLQHIEFKAMNLGIKRLFTEASITAKPFFLVMDLLLLDNKKLNVEGKNSLTL